MKKKKHTKLINLGNRQKVTVKKESLYNKWQYQGEKAISVQNIFDL